MSETDQLPRVKYRTKDLNQAAFIWAQDTARLLNVEPDGQERSFTLFFVFEIRITQEELSNLMITYANGETLVEPTRFCDRQTKLRDLLHNGIGMSRKKNH